MIECYITRNNYLQELQAPEPGCWLNLTAPTEAECNRIANTYGLDPDVIKAALDEDERSRIETDDNYTMILVNIPTIEDEAENELYSTVPLSVIITGDSAITVCSEETPILKEFSNGKVRDFNSTMRSRFILQILFRSASLFLKYLRSIDRKSDRIESQLHKAQRNEELLDLLVLEKSLLYFSTALRSNESVLEKLSRLDMIRKYEDDADLLEDVIVENRQAMEMAGIYTGILQGMMDAFGSVISNNQNNVMKMLALITLVLSIPNLVFACYGMNFDNIPLYYSKHGFIIMVIGSVILSVISLVIFMKAGQFSQKKKSRKKSKKLL